MIAVEDEQVRVITPIEGLGFEPNNVVDLDDTYGWFSTKIASSPGPLVSDFVTHEASFRYSTYGIHIGQDDRLTFFGNNGKRIVGEFVDCRRDSPTLHLHVKMSFSPSHSRRLIIPRGVAHTFDNLEHIVTRDEPVWHSDIGNPDWNFDNDLVSVDRTTTFDHFPKVKPNSYRLPDEAHLLQSKISQQLLKNPSAYLARYRMKIGGREQYVAFEPTFWSEDQDEVRALTESESQHPISFIRAKYALTGPRSWTLVPSTESCVSDVLLLHARPVDETTYWLHHRTEKLYTILAPQYSMIKISYLDLRAKPTGSHRNGFVEFNSDPRVVITIPNGVAYRIDAQQDIIVRTEGRIFVSDSEPRTDIPMFNDDIVRVSSNEPLPGLNVPSIPCPSKLLFVMGKHEVEQFAQS